MGARTGWRWVEGEEQAEGLHKWEADIIFVGPMVWLKRV